MAVGHDKKPKGEQLAQLVKLAKRNKTLDQAYELLVEIGGFPALAKVEKAAYNRVARRLMPPKRKGTPRGTKSEQIIRNAIFNHGWISIGEECFAVACYELPTKAKKSANTRGGFVDLLCIKRSGRIAIVELKAKKSSETALTGLLQAHVYRAQVSAPNYRPVLRKAIENALPSRTCDSIWQRVMKKALSYGEQRPGKNTRRKGRMQFMTLLAAPKGWTSFKNERKLLQESCARKKGSPPVCVVELETESPWIGKYLAGGPKSMA